VVQPVRAAAAQGEAVDDLGFKLMRKGVKVAAKETLLTPRCDAGQANRSRRPGCPKLLSILPRCQ
jgi:hypothetical protein